MTTWHDQVVPVAALGLLLGLCLLLVDVAGLPAPGPMRRRHKWALAMAVLAALVAAAVCARFLLPPGPWFP